MQSLLTFFSWGQSAGSVSVSLQMLTNGGDTEGLFRAAFMQSGSPQPTGDITDVGKYTDNSNLMNELVGSTILRLPRQKHRLLGLFRHLGVLACSTLREVEGRCQ